MIIYRGKNPFTAIDRSAPLASLPELREMYEFCDARKKNGEPCRQKALYRAGRCKHHGGLSTGPKTEEGKQQSRINGAKGGRPRKTQVTEGRDKVQIGENEMMLKTRSQCPQISAKPDDLTRKLNELMRKVEALRHS